MFHALWLVGLFCHTFISITIQDGVRQTKSAQILLSIVGGFLSVKNSQNRLRITHSEMGINFPLNNNYGINLRPDQISPVLSQSVSLDI